MRIPERLPPPVPPRSGGEGPSPAARKLVAREDAAPPPRAALDAAPAGGPSARRMVERELPPPPAPATTALSSSAAHAPVAYAARPPGAQTVSRITPDTRVDRLLARAAQLDSDAGASPRMKPRLDMLLALPVTAWTDWGERDIEPVRMGTSKHVEITQEYAKINPTKWADECREASTKPPGLLDRFGGQNKADFYQTRISGIRKELTGLLTRIGTLKETIRPRFETLRLDVLALNVAVEELKDATQIAIASNRAQTLVQGQQSASSLMQALESSESLIVNVIASIDTILNDVIPNWKMAQVHR